MAIENSNTPARPECTLTVHLAYHSPRADESVPPAPTDPQHSHHRKCPSTLLAGALEYTERLPALLNAFQDDTATRIDDDQRALYRRLGMHANEISNYIAQLWKVVPDSAPEWAADYCDSIEGRCCTMAAVAALVDSAKDGQYDMGSIENLFFSSAGKIKDAIEKLQKELAVS